MIQYGSARVRGIVGFYLTGTKIQELMRFKYLSQGFQGLWKNAGRLFCEFLDIAKCWQSESLQLTSESQTDKNMPIHLHNQKQTTKHKTAQ